MHVYLSICNHLGPGDSCVFQTGLPLGARYHDNTKTSKFGVSMVDSEGDICIIYYLYVDSLSYAFGWSAFLCRINFCDNLVVVFFK
jgi:hypothetical protein